MVQFISFMGLLQRTGGAAIFSFEDLTEVGKVVKTDLRTDFADILVGPGKQDSGVFKTTTGNPAPGGFVKYLPELTLKGAQASAGKPGQFTDGDA